jgi:hypothetical protein
MSEAKIIESGYYGDTEMFIIECSQCGSHFDTDNADHSLCSKACYNDAKADYED